MCRRNPSLPWSVEWKCWVTAQNPLFSFFSESAPSTTTTNGIQLSYCSPFSSAQYFVLLVILTHPVLASLPTNVCFCRSGPTYWTRQLFPSPSIEPGRKIRNVLRWFAWCYSLRSGATDRSQPYSAPTAVRHGNDLRSFLYSICPGKTASSIFCSPLYVFLNQGITIKPLVEFLKVKREEKHDKTMNERLHERVSFIDCPFCVVPQLYSFCRWSITRWLESKTLSTKLAVTRLGTSMLGINMKSSDSTLIIVAGLNNGTVRSFDLCWFAREQDAKNQRSWKPIQSWLWKMLLTLQRATHLAWPFRIPNLLRLCGECIPELIFKNQRLSP